MQSSKGPHKSPEINRRPKIKFQNNQNALGKEAKMFLFLNIYKYKVQLYAFHWETSS